MQHEQRKEGYDCGQSGLCDLWIELFIFKSSAGDCRSDPASVNQVHSDIPHPEPTGSHEAAEIEFGRQKAGGADSTWHLTASIIFYIRKLN